MTGHAASWARYGALIAIAVMATIALQGAGVAQGGSPPEEVRQWRSDGLTRRLYVTFHTRFDGDRIGIADRVAEQMGFPESGKATADLAASAAGGPAWPEGEVPVAIHYNPAFDSTQIDPETYERHSISLEDSIARALDTWNAVPAQWFRFRYAGPTTASVVGCEASDGVNSVRFTNSLSYGVLAVTCLAFTDDDPGRIYEFDILVTNRVYWATEESPPPYSFDLRTVMLHEVGHALGLEHTLEPTSVMYPSVDQGEVRRIPDTEDVEGVLALYRRPDGSGFDGSVVPNSGYTVGLNSVVVEGEGTVADVARRIALDSGHAVRIIWVYGDRWAFFLPDQSDIYGGITRFPGPVSSALVVLG